MTNRLNIPALFIIAVFVCGFLFSSFTLANTAKNGVFDTLMIEESELTEFERYRRLRYDGYALEHPFTTALNVAGSIRADDVFKVWNIPSINADNIDNVILAALARFVNIITGAYNTVVNIVYTVLVFVGNFFITLVNVIEMFFGVPAG